MKKVQVFILLLIGIFQVKSQIRNSIYIWEANDLKKQYLIRYSLNDIGITKDTLCIDSIINHFEANEKIYNNYIISDSYIFDINKLEYKKAFSINKKNSLFICEFQAIGDTIFYSSYNDSLEYYFIDLQHDSLVKINKDFYTAFSLLSPNKAKGVFYNHITKNIELLSCNSKLELGDFSCELEDTEIGFGDFPMVWIDNQCFLTQISTGKIVKVYLSGKIEDIVSIKNNKKPALMPVLYKDCNGNYYFYTVFKKKFPLFSQYPYIEKTYFINLNEKVYSDTNFIGCNFSYSFKKNKLIIFKNGTKIGSFRNYENFVFNKKILAVCYIENKYKMVFLFRIDVSKSANCNIESKYQKLIDFWL